MWTEYQQKMHELALAGTPMLDKAAYTVAALAGQARYRDTIREAAVPAALRLLKLGKANNHDPAYELLKTVSGESFGDRDYTAWERWAESR